MTANPDEFPKIIFNKGAIASGKHRLEAVKLEVTSVQADALDRWMNDVGSPVYGEAYSSLTRYEEVCLNSQLHQILEEGRKVGELKLNRVQAESLALTMQAVLKNLRASLLFIGGDEDFTKYLYRITQDAHRQFLQEAAS